MDKMVTFGWVFLYFTFRLSIGMSPLKEIYGYDASTFIDNIFGDSRDIKSKDWIEES